MENGNQRSVRLVWGMENGNERSARLVWGMENGNERSARGKPKAIYSTPLKVIKINAFFQLSNDLGADNALAFGSCIIRPRPLLNCPRALIKSRNHCKLVYKYYVYVTTCTYSQSLFHAILEWNQAHRLTVRYTASAASLRAETTFCFFSLNFSKTLVIVCRENTAYYYNFQWNTRVNYKNGRKWKKAFFITSAGYYSYRKWNAMRATTK